MEKILEKIKKLMDLSKTDNANLAANALKKAKQFMDEHNISISDLSKAEINEKTSRGINSKRPPDYVSGLAYVVSKLFGCKFYWTTTSKLNKRFSLVYTSSPVFVGKIPSEEICSYTFDVLLNQLIKARKSIPVDKCWSKNDKSQVRNSFAVGWVEGVRRNIFHLIPQEDVELPKGKGMVPLCPIDQFIESKTNGEMLSRNSKLSEEYLHRGFVKGKEVKIHKGMKGSKFEQLQLN